MDDSPIEALKETVVSHVEQLEASRRLGVPVATTRRFFEIEGLDLGGLLALELFTTVIPLILIGFGWFSGFSNSLSFGDLLIRQLELHGDGASQVRGLFGTGASLKSTWTVVGLASFLVWGIPMSSQVAKTFARAWRRERFAFLRGGVARRAVVLPVPRHPGAPASRLGSRHVAWVPPIVFHRPRPAAVFVLWSATPAILVRNGANGWKHLMWCGLAGVVLDACSSESSPGCCCPCCSAGGKGSAPSARR